MKTIAHILITHALFLALFGGAALALAEESTSTPAQTPEVASVPDESLSDEARATLEQQTQQRETMQTELQAKRETKRAELQARAQERITNLAANVSNRQEAVIARMQNIIDRINTRIDKLQALGFDTTEAETALLSAQSSVDAAYAELVTIDKQIAEVVGSEDVRTAWVKTKAVYKLVHEHLKSTRNSLRTALAALKTAAQTPQENQEVTESIQNEQTTDEAATETSVDSEN